MDAPSHRTDTITDANERTTGPRRTKPARKPRARKPATAANQAQPAHVDVAPSAADTTSEPTSVGKPTPQRQRDGQPADTRPGEAQPIDEPATEPKAGDERRLDQEDCDQDRNAHASGDPVASDDEASPGRTADDDTDADSVQADGAQSDDPQQGQIQAASTEPDSTEPDSTEPDGTSPESARSDETQPAHTPPAEEPSHGPAGRSHEPAGEFVRAHETPIFAAMFADWDGPAVGLIGRNLHRADAETMVFDAVMWRPSPDRKAPPLRFQVSGDRHAPVITATGELKAASVPLLTTPLRHILRRRPRQVIVDLAGITAVTPGALRALLDLRHAARAAHIDFWLRSPSEPVRELLQATGVQVAVRSKAPAARRPQVPGRGTARGVRAAIPEGDEDADPQAEPRRGSARSKAQSITAKLPGGSRRAAAQAQRVLEGVVIDGPPARTRQWWPSHALRESLRRVGSHHHPHADGSPT